MSDDRELGAQILEHLKFYEELGVRWTERGTSTVATSGRGASGKAKRNASPPATAPQKQIDSPMLIPSMPGADESLDAVRADLGDCRRCKLASTRKNLVFGSGNPHAELMFVGEAPGADEDAQGLPFVGRAGQLLTRIIESVDMKREDVFICNILKCRPPGNRNPETDEIAACEQFLFRQIAAVKPKIICALGTFGAQTLLRTTEPIGKLRGRLMEYRGVKFMATFHPAYLLRNPMEKRKVWEDMLIIRDYLESVHSSGA